MARTHPVQPSPAEAGEAVPVPRTAGWTAAWSTLKRDLPTRVWFAYLAILLFPYLVPVLGPAQLDRFGGTIGDVFLLAVLLLCILPGLGRLEAAAERRFWQYVSLAMLCWLLVRGSYALVPEPAMSGWISLAVDALYVGFYLFWLLASSLQAHQQPQPRSEVVPALQASGSLAVVCLLFVYFVVLPGDQGLAATGDGRTSYYLYPILDGVLAVRLLTLGRTAAGVRWRRIYFLLGIGFVMWMLLDAMEALAFLDPLLWIQAPGSRFDLGWHLSFIPVLLAARLREPLPSEPVEVPAQSRTAIPRRSRVTSPLVLSAFLMPLVHFTFYGLGLLDAAERPPRETLVLIGLLLLGGMAVAEHALLRKQQARIERQRAEASRDAEEQTAYLSSLVESSPLAIVMLDPNGRIRLCNEAFESLFLYSRDEALGRALDELIAPEELADEAVGLTRRVLDGEAVRSVTKRRRKDGADVDVECHGVPAVTDDGLIGLYVLYQDIGQRLHLESQLRHSQRMEGLGRLAGGVAHDFNNLLTTVLGFAELIELEIGSQGAVGSHLRRIRAAAERASDLVRQLLAFGRRQALQARILDLNALVSEFGPLLQRTLPENIELVLRLDPELGSIEADPGQIEQVLMNLAVNGRDAMPDGGRLTVETSNVDLDQRYVDEHPGAKAGPHVVMAVTDTGDGMDEETRRQIFEPFFTTKGHGKGTGLGLSTVYGIVKQSGGNIWVYSEPQCGSTFKVYLPRLASAPEPRAVVAVAASGGGGETLLVVEDEESVRTLTRQVLELAGYSVLTAAAADEALDRCETHAGPIHLLLTDVMLPDKRGTELAGAITARRPEVRVLYMSGYSRSSIATYLASAAEPFIEKPFSRTVLLNKVREVLDAG